MDMNHDISYLRLILYYYYYYHFSSKHIQFIYLFSFFIVSLRYLPDCFIMNGVYFSLICFVLLQFKLL